MNPFLSRLSRRFLLGAIPGAAFGLEQNLSPQLRREAATPARPLKQTPHTADLCIVGGGLAGTCAAITAARAGIRVVLMQDRPVLGGNASSEVRLWILGATAHMGNNNRWAREGGVVDEIMTENLHRNPEGNPLIVDSILLEKVREEPNIRVLLNTAVDQVEKSAPDSIAAVRAYCAQNETEYRITAPLFVDSSGDGVLGFLAGAAYRMGAETRDEFGEGFAPTKNYGALLGHSLYFYSRDTGKPVRFIPPSFALKDIHKIPRYSNLQATDTGCRLWWLEWGGRLDTVHDTEQIKWELWKVAYGVWDYFKNSGRFPEAENLTLEWIGMIPGKRESRRFEGPYILTQQDVIGQRHHEDVVSHGGWAIDLHPADGVYSPLPSCTQWHAKGVYGIPYRSMFSRNIKNLFLAGRIVSVSHVAFGSTRVMGTCSTGAQAVALAAVLCRKHGLLPADIAKPPFIRELQRNLIRAGQYIPGVRLNDDEDLARTAAVTASSRYILDCLPASKVTRTLRTSEAMMLPVAAGPLPAITLRVDANAPTRLDVELRASSHVGNFSPDTVIARSAFDLQAGPGQEIRADFKARVDYPQYVFVCLMRNPAIAVHLSDARVTGVTAVEHHRTQEPPHDSGIESFELWSPTRRPEGRNHAIVCDPPIDVFQPANVANGYTRPTTLPNAWVARPDDPSPRLALRWPRSQTIARVHLFFDTDYDHPMESVLMGHPERDIPFCVRRYKLTDEQGRVLHETTDNHQSRNVIRFEKPISTSALHIDVQETHGAPVAIFEVSCYSA